jgi:hypothetical protein
MNVSPCHHGMARPQIADGGTASDMEGSCDCIEYAVAGSNAEKGLREMKVRRW